MKIHVAVTSSEVSFPARQ